MNLFLDTNILIDLTADRQPFSNWATRIFIDAKKGKFKLHTSTISILICYYIINKQLGTNKAKMAIKVLLEYLEIHDCSKHHLSKALSSQFVDFEDAVQHECAQSHNGIDVIVTRNKKDFKNSSIAVLSSEEVFIKN